MNKLEEEFNFIENSQDSQEIDKALDVLDKALQTVKNDTKTVKAGEAPVILTNEQKIDGLLNLSLEKMKEIEKKADEIYDLHYTQVALGKDRSEQSKINLIESQKLKVETLGKTVELVNALTKLESARAKKMQAAASGMATIVTAQEAGINLEELKNVDFTELEKQK